MPKYSYMISKAVDLVANKLAGMDADTISRLTQVLSEEAQVISEELQGSGRQVDADMLAAKLDGLVMRMKYEIRNQDPDPSPHEFPIFNVSHNPEAPYPNPINHLYDKRYKEAFSTFIKQSPSLHPTNDVSAKNSSSATPKPTPPSNASSNQTYSQGPTVQQLAPPNNFRRPQPPDAWQHYNNPYATMPRGQAAQYQQRQVLNQMPSISEQSTSNGGQRMQSSSTDDDRRQRSLSRSASANDLDFSTDPNGEKIRVRVVNNNNNPSFSGPTDNNAIRNRNNLQRSILKPNNQPDDNSAAAMTRRIYADLNTEIGQDTMEQLFQVVDQQRTGTSNSNVPLAERIIIIDRRGSNESNEIPNITSQDRLRTFEIRSEKPSAIPIIPPSPATSQATAPTTAPAIAPAPAKVQVQAPTPTPVTPILPTSSYVQPSANYYQVQPLMYQQPRTYSSVPNLFPNGTAYNRGANAFYPFVYYRY